ncbi:hypothetical protein C5B42_02835 [Candidatus Cerribacteria bacterium 'Amazon FNV 2010 28 9']|uniref:Sugar ABC transporter substrate-binding protein n=1 Tax=Candidatus Cerribacteria bacterium 'Amazon FNV 2010 28 9' TaxID=2081795 RepID=A0A317JNU5_9BACT|nr:MAG: hypothetical protein C5B42_02835 [Candidatus Cerribacteria bacterium 'Amazon FNV 2010 28 9']
MEPVSPNTTQTPQQNSSVSESIPSFNQTTTPPPAQKAKFSLPLPLIGIGVAALVVAAVIFFIVRGALSHVTSSSSNAPTKNETLTWWGLWEPSDVLQSVITQFEQQNPGVTIQYAQQSPKDYRERLQSAFARGQGPDIFRFHNTWVPMLAEAGVYSALPSSVMTTAEFNQTFYPVMQKDMKTSAGYVGIPLMYDGLGLYINKKALADAGQSVPTTWEDLSTLAKSLTIRDSSGKIARAGIALGSSNNVDHFSDILALLILQNGGSPGNPSVTDSNGNNLVGDALTFYTQFEKVDKVWDETLPNSTYAFATEKAAMMLAPSWRSFEVKQINPNIDFEVVPVPQLPGTPVTWASYWAEGVSKTAKDQVTAWKFLKYLSSAAVLQKLYTSESNTRLFGEVYPRVDMASQLSTDPYAGAFAKEAPNAASWYMASNTFDNGINDEIIKYYQDAVNSMNNDRQASDVLPTLTSGVTSVLQKYQLAPQSAQ